MGSICQVHPGIYRAIKRARVYPGRSGAVYSHRADCYAIPTGDNCGDASAPRESVIQHTRSVAGQRERDGIHNIAGQLRGQRRTVRWGDVWLGSTVVVMASGPSLNAEDVDVVKQWRESEINRYVIVTNTTFQIAPWADALFFHDLKWWKKYKDEVRRVFSGRMVTVAPVNLHGVDWMRNWDGYGNSGAAAIALAVLAGASKVVLLGLDCQYTSGRRHWHGDHPPGLGNAKSLKKWPASFARLSNHCRRMGVDVVNCSRQTALDCFDRQPLESVICLR